MVLTFRYRIKNPKRLLDLAKAVNFAWNFCGETQKKAQRDHRPWPTRFDLIKLMTGAGKELGLHSDTVQAVASQFATSRDSKKKCPRWRCSAGAKRSLGWIPFAAGRAIGLLSSDVKYLGVTYPLWLHRSIEGRILCGSFSEDARGHWYLNLQCDVAQKDRVATGQSVGIDLGLKDMAGLSNGSKIENPRFFRGSEKKLAVAQRAGHKKRARAIHAKVKNRRRHVLHVESKRLVDQFDEIYVGNVNSAALGKTNLAKSVYDVGWSEFRSMLCYKAAMRQGVRFAVVNERFSTQVCSSCGVRGGPRGLKDLAEREWDCPSCGAHHDRDTNAAMNILLSGRNADLQLTESPLLE